MKMKQWRPFSDCCPWCGDEAQVFTESDREDYVYDGEAARCVSCQCPGSVVVDDGHAVIAWHDEHHCGCEWCLAHPEAP